MKKLLLFDIDGTILRLKSGLAVGLFDKLFEKRFKVKVRRSTPADFSGQTDLGILFEIAEMSGVKREAILEVINEIWDDLSLGFREICIESNLEFVPGAEDAIKKLSKDSDVMLGLLTGNFEKNAFNKLNAVGIGNYFRVGAYGSDDADRNKLPIIAINRANRIAGEEIFSTNNTIIIGDTYRDVECARANSMPVITVAGGRTSKADLDILEPDASFYDLRDFNAFEKELNKLIEIQNEA